MHTFCTSRINLLDFQTEEKCVGRFRNSIKYNTFVLPRLARMSFDVACVGFHGRLLRGGECHARHGVNHGSARCVIKSALKLYRVRVPRVSGVRYYCARCTRDFSVPLCRTSLYRSFASRDEGTISTLNQFDPQTHRSQENRFKKFKNVLELNFSIV